MKLPSGKRSEGFSKDDGTHTRRQQELRIRPLVVFCVITNLALMLGIAVVPALDLVGIVVPHERWVIGGIVALAFGIDLIIPLVWRRMRRRANDHPACHECGRDLTGVVTGRCPECGIEV